MIYPDREGRHCCGKPQAPAELDYMNDAGSRSAGAGPLILFKFACCGGLILLIALASGAVALSAILAGTAGLALAGAAVLLLRPRVCGAAR